MDNSESISLAPDQGSDSQFTPAVAPVDPLIGQRIGGYKVLKRIGRGGQGVVYQGINIRSGQNVAIKILHLEHLNDPGRRKRFLREAQVLEVLRGHASILQVYEVGEYADYPYLALEHMATNVLDLLNAYPNGLPIGYALQIALDATEALEFAHSRSILHRDIKPSNILLNGLKEKAKLADFGMAHASELSPLSGSGSVRGTPRYIAPELLEGKPVSARSDIYALGLTLLEMLAGLHAAGQSPERAVRGGVLELPEPIRKIITAALEKDPRNRIQTAAELGAALSTALEFTKYQASMETVVEEPGDLDVQSGRADQVISRVNAMAEGWNQYVMFFSGFSLLHFSKAPDAPPLLPSDLSALELPFELLSRRHLGIVLSGPLPVWFFSRLVCLANTFAWVATYNPTLGGAVVVARLHINGPSVGSIWSMHPPESHLPRL